ncbi:MAG: hypothetical protein IJW49_00080 [Clostridia bacterium]|nr:hypothetical protein [Clostridia bacterium]
METNEKILEELQEIKKLLIQLLEENKWVNDNIATATEHIVHATRVWGS